MDSSTLNYYSANAQAVAQSYEAAQSSLGSRFATAFAPGGRILDIGCGSGGQTISLAKNLNGQIIAVDLFPEFLNELNEKSQEAMMEIQGELQPYLLLSIRNEKDQRGDRCLVDDWSR